MRRGVGHFRFQGRLGFRPFKLQRRLFVWFGISILVTGAVVGLTSFLLGPGRFGWQRQYDAAQRFVGGEFAAVWDDPQRRDALASRAAREFDVDIVLENAEKKPLKVFGSSCRRADFASRVEQQGKLVGWVRICGRHGHPRGFTFVLVLGAAGLTLWAASGFIARRLVRPFGELVRVTEEIGAGNLAARTQLDRRRAAEVGVVGEAINRMADRIERQIADQRELLAGV